MRVLYALLATLTLLLGSCATQPGGLPDRSSTRQTAAPASVIAANPQAVRAGMEVLERGGSAADAAIAVQAMLSLVEPQSSGIGGGGFINFFDGETGRVVVYDGRETAPAQATSTMFLGTDGKPIPFREAVVSGRATGVPGAVAALELVHREHGRLPWRGLFDASIRTAEDGFIVSPRLGRFLTNDFPQLSVADARAYFTKADGTRVAVGDRLMNPAFAAFLQRLSAQGSNALYRGQTAARIVQATRAAPLGGTMTVADLTNYRAVKREPLCRPYRAYRVCAPPPPSSGVSFLQLLGLLERTDIATRGPADPQAWFLFAEASRLMYADRDAYVGDADFVAVPVAGLLDPAYLDTRAALIGTAAAPRVVAGRPAGASVPVAARSFEPAGTSHFIVGDARGDVVSMTTTVESIFGTGRMVDGFFLNNQLTDFSFSPVGENGLAHPNAVAGGKRPRSSMIPLILLDREGRFAGAIGSAGGSAILAYVGKSLVAAIDWGLPMQEALALPNLVARGENFSGEADRFDPAVIAGLLQRGITVRPGQGEDSGVHGVLIRRGQVDGGFDPRREGAVLISGR